jgi:tRNA (cmo5U34)-methyltransferase
MNSGKQDFSFDTIQDFDDHIAKSIANYDLLADAIRNIVDYFLVKDTALLDLGCSTGELLKSIKHDGRKIGVDKSDNLLPNDTEETEFYNYDLTNMKDYPKSSVIMSIFTLQFIDRDKREEIIKRIYDSLIDGGVFIWAEKVVCPSGKFQEIMNFSHYDYKLKTFSAKEILDKEKDLRRLMRLNTTRENMELAEKAGFSQKQIFWKFYNFECWLLVK